jgi:hypothetical protein
MSPHALHIVLTVVFIVLIAWRMQARVRRLIGRQRFSRWRSTLTVVLFPLLIALLARAPHHVSQEGNYLIVGLGLGLVLGLLGLRLTRFEVTAEGHFYTPNAHLGVALSVLLVARIAYRFATGGFGGTAAPGAPPPGLTPLTLLLIGALAGYYWTYAAGLLWWSVRQRAVAASDVPES